MFDLTGKCALITGASGGIGGSIAKALHAAGATVGLSGTRIEPLEALAAEQRLTIKVKTDPSLIEGGFVLESNSFYVDGTVESRLKDVLNSLDKPQ